METTWTILVNRDAAGWERLLGDALVAYLTDGGDLANVRVRFYYTEIPDIRVRHIHLT
jgi:hypothetical protein